MDVSIIVAVMGTVIAVAGSVIALAVNRPNRIAEQRSASSLTYETLTKSILNLSQENDGLRARLVRQESYVVYLIDGIRERCAEWKPLDFGAWSSADLRSDVGLVNALVVAFDLAGFDRMLRAECGRSRERITTASGLDEIVGDVVDSAEREGWLHLLKKGAVAANPTNEELKRAAN